MNLSIGKSLGRIGEIGIRKVNGATKIQLIRQFMVESMLLSLIALIIAGLTLEAGGPIIDSLLGKQVSVNYFRHPDLLVYFMLIFLFTGLVPGCYPAVYLSSIPLTTILQGSFRSGPKGQRISKILVIIQFTIALMLISGSIIIFSQLRFFQQKDLGFEKEHLLVIPIKSERVRARFSALKTELLAIKGVNQVPACSNVPGRQFNQNSIFLAQDPQHRVDASEWMVDEDVVGTLGLQLVAGRPFSLDYATDSVAAFMVNQKALERLDLKQPLGSSIVWQKDDVEIKGKIIGVLSDFHFQSLHQPVRPILVVMRKDYNHAILKIDSKHTDRVISKIQRVWEGFDQQFAFEYTFLDETLDEQYRAESNLCQTVNSFAVLAVILACLGLFGIAKLSFAKKIKPIGIRKVMGAETSGLIMLLLKDYSRLVIAAVLIGIPICWVVMQNWLQNFEYRISINPLVFVVTGLCLLFVTWLGLGYLTYKTVKVNPAETLKDE